MFEPLEPKASGAEKDYGIDWTNYIADDSTITGADWAIESPLGSPALEIAVETIVGLFTLVRLTGGEEDRDYVLVCTPTLSNGEVLPEAIKVRVRSVAEIAGL